MKVYRNLGGFGTKYRKEIWGKLERNSGLGQDTCVFRILRGTAECFETVVRKSACVLCQGNDTQRDGSSERLKASGKEDWNPESTQ